MGYSPWGHEELDTTEGLNNSMIGSQLLSGLQRESQLCFLPCDRQQGHYSASLSPTSQLEHEDISRASHLIGLLEDQDEACKELWGHYQFLTMQVSKPHNHHCGVE